MTKNTPYGLFVEGLEDDFHCYLHEIGEYPTLSPEQERELIERIRQGNTEARNYFLHCNLKLVVSIARNYTGRGLPALDLIQEGNLGLMHALDLFNEQRGFKFSTYATIWIKQHITRALHGRLVHVPEWVILKASQLHKLEAQLPAQLGHEPSDEELANALDISLEWLYTIRQSVQSIASLDMPLEKRGTKSGAEEDITLGMRLEDMDLQSQQESAEHSELKAAINSALDMLSTRERAVVKLRFGLDDEGGKRSLDMIGQEFHVTRERIRQNERKALDKLKVSLAEVAQRWLGGVA